ncbi:MAG: cyclic nucleotide-binding domain-containing protein [Acidobacteriota bacterium]
MILRAKARFELLDQYLARREYALALEAISEEIKRRPENFNLLLRQAEMLGQAGDRDEAIAVYQKLAKHYTDQGFYARAIAVTNKIVRLDPTRKQVTAELAELIAAQQEVEQATRKRLERSVTSTGLAAAKAHAAPPKSEEPFGPAPPPPPVAGPGELEPPAPPFSAAIALGPPRPAAAEDLNRQAEREREASRFFAAFPRAALEQLLASTSVRSFSPGEVIVREGEPGDSLYLIAHGTVEVHTNDSAGRDVVLAALGPGDFFGEVAVLTGRPRTATIVAQEPVTVIEIERENLREIAAAHPDVSKVLDRFYRQRAEATVEAMLARLRRSRV